MTWLISTTLFGSIIGLLILVIKKIFNDKLSAHWHLAIWLILIIKIFLPNLPSSDLSFFNLMPDITRTYDSNESQILDEKNNSPSTIENTDATTYELAEVIELIVVENNFNKYKSSLIYIWIVGMVCFFTIHLFGYLRFLNAICKLEEESNKVVLKLVNSVSEKIGLKSQVRVIKGGTSPGVFGFIRTTVQLPEVYTIDEKEQILFHEFTHIKYGDLWLNLFITALNCLFWFNPIIWLCCKEAKKDIEVLCDDRVIRINGDRKKYAETLLKVAIYRPKPIPLTSSMYNGEKEIVRRIKRVSKYRKSGKILAVASIVFFSILTVTMLTSQSSNIEPEGGEGTLESPKEESILSDKQANVINENEILRDNEKNDTETVLYKQEGETINDIIDSKLVSSDPDIVVEANRMDLIFVPEGIADDLFEGSDYQFLLYDDPIIELHIRGWIVPRYIAEPYMEEILMEVESFNLGEGISINELARFYSTEDEEMNE